MQTGQRIKLTKDVDRYPFALVKRGETGTVLTWNPNAGPMETILEVRLDKHHEGLDEWGNSLVFTSDDLDSMPRLSLLPSA